MLENFLILQNLKCAFSLDVILSELTKGHKYSRFWHRNPLNEVYNVVTNYSYLTRPNTLQTPEP